jgi:energy-coupling factor transporter ATP-binding protein EcfA2
LTDDYSAGPFTRLILRNVRCFRDAKIELDPQLTVLIGENGAGKTTAVEALASLSAGEYEGLAEFPLTRGARTGEIALYGKRERAVAQWRSGRSAAARRRLPEDRYLLAYGRYRRVLFPEEKSAEERDLPLEAQLGELAFRARRKRTATLFEPDNHLLQNLSRSLTILHFAREGDPRVAGMWSRLDRSLADLGHGIEGIRMEEESLGFVPKVIRHGIPLELGELSDGYQALLVVVFDLIIRYLYLFPGNPEPLLGHATVVIDEVDLHLHPRWQRRVASQLTTLFPNTQFILTTHSAAVVQEAIDLGWTVVALREGSSGATATALSRDEMAALKGAEIGSVLLEESLFDLESRYSTEYSQVEERIESLQRKIQDGGATEADRRRLFANMERLQKLVAADEERRADGSFLSQIMELRLAFLRDLAAEIERAKE